MKRVIACLLALCLLATLDLPGSLVTSAAEAVSAANDFISITLGDEGGFGINTVGGNPHKEFDDHQPLLYTGDGFNTSYTTVQVDDKNYIYGSSAGRYTQEPALQTVDTFTQLVSIWEVDGVSVKQILTLESNPENDNAGNVNIRYEVLSVTGSKRVGVRILLDTKIGESDGPGFFLGADGIPALAETEMSGKDVPEYFRVADSLYNPTIIAYGVLSYPGSTAPDRFIAGHWGGLADTLWSYTPGTEEFVNDNNKYKTADSAAAIYFNPVTVSGTAATVFETYYGIGRFGQMEGEDTFDLTVDSGNTLKLNPAKDGYVNDIVTITAQLDNSLTVSANLTEVAARLVLEDGMSLVEGSQVQSAQLISRGEVRSFQWKVRIDPQAEYTAKTAMVAISAKELMYDRLASKMFVAPSCAGLRPALGIDVIAPGEVYYRGISNVTLKGAGFELLEDGEWQLYLRPANGSADRLVPNESINIIYDTDSGDKSRASTIAVDFEGFDDYVGAVSLVMKFHPDSPLYKVWKNGELVSSTTLQVTKNLTVKNKNYGIIAIVQADEGDPTYTIEPFKDEAALTAYKADDDHRVLVTLRGQFRKSEEDGVYRAGTDSQGVTINNVVRYTGSAPLEVVKTGKTIRVTGDGKLDVIGALTFWKWAFYIEFHDNFLYSMELEPDTNERPVVIQFDTAFGYMIQNISGFAISLKFGQLIELDDGLRSGVSFGGSLRVSFLPGKKDSSGKTDSPATDTSTGGGDAASANSASKKTSDPFADSNKIVVAVDDVVFGERAGKDNGFVGIKTTLGIKLEPDSTPSFMKAGVGAELSINTFEHEYGVAAEVEVADLFEAEARLVVVLLDGKYPLLDEIWVKVDTAAGIPIVPGVLDLTGGGLGYRGLADTVTGDFDKFPPFTIMGFLGAKILSIVKVEADIEIGGSHVSLEVMGKALNGNFALGGSFYLQWADPLNGKVALSLNIFDCIIASGGVAFTKNYFGGLLRGGLFIPSAIPLVGGLEVLGAGVMVSTECVGGYVSIIGIPVGCMYYYGEKVRWITGSDVDKEFSIANIGFDSKDVDTGPGGGTGPTTRMVSALHVTEETTAEGVQAFGLFGVNLEPVARLGILSTSQTVSVPDNMDTVVFKVDYEGDTRPALTVTGPGGEYKLEELKQELRKSPEDETRYINEAVNEATANLTYDDNYGNAYISVRGAAAANPKGNWTVSCSNNVNFTVTLINARKPISVKSVDTFTINNTTATVTASFADVETGCTASIFLVDSTLKKEEQEADSGILLAADQPIAVAADGTGTVTWSGSVPATLASGSYIVRVVAENPVTGAFDDEVSAASQAFVNKNYPEAFNEGSSISVRAAGNGQLSIWASAPFYAEIYGPDDKLLPGFDIWGEAGEEVLVGGTYRAVGENGQVLTDGVLEPDVDYTVKLYQVNRVDGYAYLSPAYTRGTYSVPKPTPPEVEITYGDMLQPFPGAAGETEYVSAQNRVTIGYVVGQKDCTVTAEINGAMDYSLPLDGEKGTLTLDAEDGDNLIKLVVTNKDGDRTVKLISFSVQAAPPDLLLFSPTMGGVSNADGSYTVSGRTTPGAAVTINKQAVAVNESGEFTAQRAIPQGRISEALTVTASNALGLSTTVETTVLNGSIAALDRLVISGGKTKPALGETVTFQATVYDINGKAVVVDPDDIVWEVLGPTGTATISRDGAASFHDAAEYLVRASYLLPDGYKLTDGFLVNTKAETIQPGPSGGGSRTDTKLNAVIKEMRDFLGSKMLYQTQTLYPERRNEGGFGTLTFVTPAGVVLNKDTLVIGRAPATPELLGISGATALSEVFQLTTVNQGDDLTREMTITIGFDADKVVNRENVGLYTWNDTLGRWMLISSQLDFEEGTATFSTQTLDKYVVLENSGMLHFGDIDGSRWSAEAIYALTSMGILNGVLVDGELVFQPQRDITRAEFIKILVMARGIDIEAEDVAGMKLTFADNADIAPWSVPYIKAAVRYGLVAGRQNPDGSFSIDPKTSITRQEAMTLLYRAFFPDAESETVLPFTDTDTASTYAGAPMAVLYDNGLLNGYDDGTVRPRGNITREEAAALYFRCIKD